MKTRSPEDMDMARVIGEQIYARRMDRGLTQLQLGRLAGCENGIGEIENGRRIANVVTLYRIARALSCDIGLFFAPIRAAEHAKF